MQQIQQLEMQKRAIELQNSQDNNDNMQQQNNMQNNFQNNNFNDQSFSQIYDQNFAPNNQHYGSESGDNYASNNSMSGNENSYDSQTFDQITNQKKNEIMDEPDLSNLPNVNFSQPPPGFTPNDNSALLAFQNGLPDLSKPPPGFPPFPEINNEELMPSVPYFELPAGLMVPLIMVSWKINVITYVVIEISCSSVNTIRHECHILAGGW